MENLEKLEAIGLTEAYEDSLEKINNAFGWQLQSRHTRNAGQSSPAIAEEWKEAITEICEMDILIYEKAKKLFECK
jgi:hypothetical protein